MKRKIVWLLVSGLMVLALLLASCGPAVTEEEEEEVTEEEEEGVTEEEEEEEEEEGPEMVRDSLGRLVEKPKYGGVFKQPHAQSPLYFDEAFGHQYVATTLYQTNETLLQGDWTKGPAGTGETSWIYLAFPDQQVMAGRLAESWEVTEPDTIVYHIRQGVHFHDKPPTNGREMTADDVGFTMKYLWQESPASYHRAAYRWEDNIQSITATDKWTVVIKAIPGQLGRIFEHASCSTFILPRDAVEEYGDLGDWENSIGTGPFMLTDYVVGSTATFVRNPNYWQKDPLLPENQLPYLDGVQYLIIPDSSTRMAAMRTGKIDWLGRGWEDAEELSRTNPELQHTEYLNAGSTALFMRIDRELPFNDIRVRQALTLAINQQEMVDTIYGGHGVVLNWPLAPLPDFADIYTPLEELPENVRELYEYHPDKARQLLAEAGYPDGFRTEIVCYSAYADTLAIIKDYWADIGVELVLDVREYGAFTTVGYRKGHEEMYVFGTSTGLPFRFTRIAKDQMWNYSMVEDPRIEEAHAAVNAARFDEPARRQLMKEINPYIIEQAYVIALPAGTSYYFWQPWVKNYHGEYFVGYMGSMYDFPQYIWIDQDLREELTGRR
jgi:peptide/nickel transport system substrate-binding protein